MLLCRLPTAGCGAEPVRLAEPNLARPPQRRAPGTASAPCSDLVFLRIEGLPGDPLAGHVLDIAAGGDALQLPARSLPITGGDAQIFDLRRQRRPQRRRRAVGDPARLTIGRHVGRPRALDGAGRCPGARFANGAGGGDENVWELRGALSYRAPSEKLETDCGRELPVLALRPYRDRGATGRR
jgi:hypothetical protein